MVFPVFFLLLIVGQAPAVAPVPEVNEARQLFQAGQLDEAVRSYQKILEDDPDSGPAVMGLVEALIWNRGVDEAEEAATRFHQQRPTAEAWTALGDVHFRRARFLSATTAYQNALSLDPELARAHLGMGKVLETERMLTDAAEYYRKAWELDPHHPEIIAAYISLRPNSAEKRELWLRYAELAGYRDPTTLRSIRSSVELASRFSEVQWWRLVNEPTRAEIPLRRLISRRRTSGWTIKVRFNDNKERKLLLDTGASGVWLEKKFLKKDKLEAVSEVALRGVGDDGIQESIRARARSVKVGNIEFADCLVVLGDSEIQDADGVIGPDLFDQFLVTLDLPGGRLILEPEEAAPAGYGGNRTIGPQRRDFTKARMSGSHFFVQTILNDEAPAYFLVDTGASVNIVSEKLSTKFTRTTRSDSVLRGFSGAVRRTMQGESILLQFGNFQQLNKYIFVMDFGELSHSFGFELNGILGVMALQQLVVTLDYRNGLVRFRLPQ